MKDKENKGDFKIPDEALKKIKSQSELDDFFSDLYKQAVEGILKAEMKVHLGYEKHRAKEKPGDNSRNGFSKKTLKTSIGDIPLDVPRDRESSFDPVIVTMFLGVFFTIINIPSCGSFKSLSFLTLVSFLTNKFLQDCPIFIGWDMPA